MTSVFLFLPKGLLRLLGQKPQLGQHHLRCVPVHRLLRDAQVSRGAPHLYQVSQELFTKCTFRNKKEKGLMYLAGNTKLWIATRFLTLYI